MHLGNGAITPECAAVASGAAAIGLGVAVLNVRQHCGRHQLKTAALLAAGVLAAQAVNIPVTHFSSAHLVGGVLLAWVLGPSLGVLAMSAVLLVQALVMGDGGLAALGANIVNMALVPAMLVACTRRLTNAENSKTPAATAGLLAAIAVMASAALIVAETAAFRSAGQLAGWDQFAGMMFATHLPICLLEGAATAALVVMLQATQRDNRPLQRPAAQWSALSLVVVLAILAPLASTLPDGYESAALQSGRQAWLTSDVSAIGVVGRFNAAADQLQQSVATTLNSLLLAKSLLILVAAAAAGGLTAAAVRTISTPRRWARSVAR